MKMIDADIVSITVQLKVDNLANLDLTEIDR